MNILVNRLGSLLWKYGILSKLEKTPTNHGSRPKCEPMNQTIIRSWCFKIYWLDEAPAYDIAAASALLISCVMCVRSWIYCCICKNQKHCILEHRQTKQIYDLKTMYNKFQSLAKSYYIKWKHPFYPMLVAF